MASLVALAAASCLAAPTPSPASLSVANDTTVPVAIAVNGIVVETVAAGTTESPLRSALPRRPWTVEALSPSGRVLARLRVDAEADITATAAVSVTEDLSCGRLEVWAGGPHGGAPVKPSPWPPCD